MRKFILFGLGIFFVVFSYSQIKNVEFIPLPEQSRNDSPVFAFSQDGTLWLAWPSYQQGCFRLAVCCRKEGVWSVIDYPDDSSAEQLEPQLVIGPNGNPCLFYSTYDGYRWEIKQILFHETGWEETKVLGQGIHPTATVKEKIIWVAWEREGQIIIKKGEQIDIDSEAIPLKPETAVEAYSSPQLSSGPGGEVWLAWTSSQCGYQSVLLKRIDEENRPVLVVDDGYGVNRNPRISVDAEGRAWVVYENLKPMHERNSRTWREEGRPIYLLDRGYSVECPSCVVKVTDGTLWWTPNQPKNPALGLMPNIYCSTKGTVWLGSRAFTGFSRPFKYFCPRCESLGPDGWKNHGIAWFDGQSYKATLALCEGPDGKVWAAWAQHDREKKGYQDTPSWTHMDGADKIAVAPTPALKKEGMPRLVPLQREKIVSPEPIIYSRYKASYKGQTLQVYFGDLHQHSEFSGCGRWNGRIDQNQRYSRNVRGLDFMCTIDHAEHLNDHTWHVTQLVAQMNNLSGKFITFTGFEWTSEFDAGGNLYRGHYNAIFRDVEKGDYYFSASDQRYNTPLELWEALKKTVGGTENVLTFPHHPSRRMAWLSWNYYDPEMVPLIEIAQARGSYEYEGCFTGLELDNDCSRVRGHYIHDGLALGMRWGFIASGDHGGRQLVAVFSSRLNRNDIFDSLRAKRCYATNGERMFLDVRLNEHFMGEEFILNGDERKLKIKVRGTSPLVEIDLFRNGRSIRKWAIKDKDVELEWMDKEPLFQRENYYYVRALQEDGGLAWSSPIWAMNPNFPGEFRFQVGGDELRVVYPEQETDFAILMHNETEVAVKGTVFLEVPKGWIVKEKNGIVINCSAGGWRQAVFHVKAPKKAITQLCLPEVKTRLECPDGQIFESLLFVVGSPKYLSREQKAVLIDARTEIPRDRFLEYFEKRAKQWGKEE